MAEVARDDEERVRPRKVRREQRAVLCLDLLRYRADDNRNDHDVLPGDRMARVSARARRVQSIHHRLPREYLAHVREVHLDAVLVLIGCAAQRLEFARRLQLLHRWTSSPCVSAQHAYTPPAKANTYFPDRGAKARSVSDTPCISTAHSRHFDSAQPSR